MAKWADYLVSKVRYDETKTTKHISQLNVHAYDGKNFEAAVICSRKEVIAAIDLGCVFYTIYQDAMGNWKTGAKIEKTSGGFITTEPDTSKQDNLGSLPEF